MKKSKPKRRETQGDDRNLVLVEEGFAEADIEDKLFLFWKKYRNPLLMAILILGVGVVGYQLMALLAARKEATIQAAFQEAENRNERLNFAFAYPQHPLAGLAYLKVADGEYTEKQYPEAANYYLQATDLLSHPSLAGRAQLGYAIASIQGDDQKAGKEALEAMVDNAVLLSGSRAEAAYHLAILSWEAEDYPKVRKLLDFISNLDDGSGYWIHKASRLHTTFPQLHELEGTE